MAVKFGDMRDGVLGAIVGAGAASIIFAFGAAAPAYPDVSTVCMSRGGVIDGGAIISADVSGRLVSDAGVRWTRANGAWPETACDKEVFEKANALLGGKP